MGVDVETNSDIINLGFLFQATPIKGPIEPYIEGMAGLAIVKTTTKVSSPLQTGNQDQTFAESENSSDTSFIYGFGMGVKVLLFSAGPSRTISMGNVFLDLKYRRFYSNSKTTFINVNTIDPATDTYQTISEKITYESYQLGISAEF